MISVLPCECNTKMGNLVRDIIDKNPHSLMAMSDEEKEGCTCVMEG